MKKRILLVDDHSVVIAGTKIILQKAIDDLEFDEALSGDAAAEKIKSGKSYDLLILDINMPGFDSGRFISFVRKTCKELPILIFTMNAEETYGLFYIRLGVKGYVNKDSPSEILVAAVRKLLDGKLHFSENHIYNILSGSSANKQSLSLRLSSRELDVTQQLIKGVGLTEIAKILNISASTVASHKTRIFEKLHINNIVDLVKIVELENNTYREV